MTPSLNQLRTHVDRDEWPEARVLVAQMRRELADLLLAILEQEAFIPPEVQGDA